jgi:hypothetical protein
MNLTPVKRFQVPKKRRIIGGKMENFRNDQIGAKPSHVVTSD